MSDEQPEPPGEIRFYASNGSETRRIHASGWSEHIRHVWTGLMAGFAPAETDRSTTNSGDVGGPIFGEDCDD